MNLCNTCSKIRHRKCSNGNCEECNYILKKDKTILKQLLFLKQHGYEVINTIPTIDKHGKYVYHLIKIRCGHEYSGRYDNIAKQFNDNNEIPCSICGAKNRIEKCLNGYLDRYAKDYDISKFEDYKNKVRKLSDKNYKNNKNLINPNNHKRGRTTYHLDHIIPIIECFKNNISIEIAGNVNNLQILPFEENLIKHSRHFDKQLLEKMILLSSTQ